MAGEAGLRGHRCLQRILAIAACLAALAGCSPSTAPPGRLRVGVLPDTRPEQLHARHAPLLAYLQARLEVPCELVIPASYEVLVADFAAGRVDLGFFGGYTYALARERAGADPLVMRDVDRHVSSYFLTSARDGEVDLGAANSVLIEQMFERGDLRSDEVAIVWETPPYADYVWAVPAGTPPDFRRRLREAFLALSRSDPADAAVLHAQGTGAYLPAAPEDFRELEEVVRAWRAANAEKGGRA